VKECLWPAYHVEEFNGNNTIEIPEESYPEHDHDICWRIRSVLDSLQRSSSLIPDISATRRSVMNPLAPVSSYLSFDETTLAKPRPEKPGTVLRAAEIDLGAWAFR
jgi:hypothetical protein